MLLNVDGNFAEGFVQTTALSYKRVFTAKLFITTVWVGFKL